MKVLLFGYKGKIGSIVLEKLEAEGASVIKVEKEDSLLDNNLQNTTFAIDFSDAKESLKHAVVCNNNNIPLLICTTGQTEKQISKMQKIKATVPIVVCHNTSRGTGIILKILKSLERNIFDSAHIHEIHNKNKKDTPSGTALMLQQALKNQNISCVITSERTNHNIISNVVKLFLDNEILEIKHVATSKELFADGAIEIAKELKTLPPKVYINTIFRGLYEAN